MCGYAHVRNGSIATEMSCTRDVRFPPNSDQTADIAGGPFRAMNRHASLFDHLIGSHDEHKEKWQ
jgi:hypothetical protein